MATVNKVIIVGRLGRDPEVRQFQNGGGVTNISVATSEQWTDKNTGEKKEQTEWHKIALYGRLGEIASQYLRKGSLVYIEGSIKTNKWQDQNGQDRYSTEIRANQMQMLDSRSQGGDVSPYNQPPYNQLQQNGWDNAGMGGMPQHTMQPQHTMHGQTYGGFGHQGNIMPQNTMPQGGYPQQPPVPQQPIPQAQGFSTPNPATQQAPQMPQSHEMSGNAFMNTPPVSAPVPTKAITPPTPTGVADDDMPF